MNEKDNVGVLLEDSNVGELCKYNEEDIKILEEILYPNPKDNTIDITFLVPSPSELNFNLYNTKGIKLKTLKRHY